MTNRCRLVLIYLAAIPAFAQRSHVLLDDAKALVTQIELPAGLTYSLAENENGTVWTALDPVAVSETKDGKQGQKRVDAGDAETVHAG